MELFEILPKTSMLRILDVGALSSDNEAYNNLAGEVEIIGFEPDKNECERLNSISQNQSIKKRFFPMVIGDGTKKLFHTTNYGMNSSLFRPNFPLLEKYQGLPELFKVVDIDLIQTHRLDDIPELSDVDFIKIDVQGAEKEIFENCPNLLKNVSVIQTEVEFVSLYQNQPLFADVDPILRNNGFQFLKFLGFGSRMMKPFFNNNNPYSPGNQQLWADVVYVKDILALQCMKPDKLLKMALIMHGVFQVVDLSYYILQEYDKLTGEQVAQRYQDLITG